MVFIQEEKGMELSMWWKRGKIRQESLPEQVGAIGSPVLGEIEEGRGGERPEVAVCPREEKVYAPTAGKVIRLYPPGNALSFRTDSGVDLFIRVGDSTDELLSRYYRPRVLQNEIVAKGKLLLEFDRAGLAAEGIFPRVILTVDNRIYGREIFPVQEGNVRPGEELLKIYSYSGFAQAALN